MKDLSTEKKEIIEILTRLRKETGWLLDIPNANFGDISDGDRSRRFFWRFKIYLWRNKLQLSPNILLKNHTGDNFKWHTLDPEKIWEICIWYCSLICIIVPAASNDSNNAQNINSWCSCHDEINSGRGEIFPTFKSWQMKRAAWKNGPVLLLNFSVLYFLMGEVWLKCYVDECLLFPFSHRFLLVGVINKQGE